MTKPEEALRLEIVELRQELALLKSITFRISRGVIYEEQCPNFQTRIDEMHQKAKNPPSRGYPEPLFTLTGGK